MVFEQEPRPIGKLISIIHRYGHSYFDSVFSGLDIGHGPRNFLAALFCREGMTQDELSESLMMDKTTTARAVKKLLQAGYIVRKRDEKDHRYYHLYLTYKALELAPFIWEARARWTAILSKGFTEEEKEQIYSFLQRAADNAACFRVGDFTAGFYDDPGCTPREEETKR